MGKAHFGLLLPLTGANACLAQSGDYDTGAAVLLVGDVFAPGDGAARVVGLLDRDVGHEAVGGGAVPVVLAGLEEHAVAGADLLYRAALALAEADALGDIDRLPERVGVPGGAGAGSEVDEVGLCSIGSGRCGDCVDVDGSVNQSLGPIAVSTEFLVICMLCLLGMRGPIVRISVVGERVCLAGQCVGCSSEA